MSLVDDIGEGLHSSKAVSPAPVTSIIITVLSLSKELTSDHWRGCQVLGRHPSFLSLCSLTEKNYKILDSFQKWKLIIHDYMWKLTKAFALEPTLAWKQHWRRWLQMFIPVTRQFGISWSFPFHTTLISQQIGEVTQACQSMSIWKQDRCNKKIALLLWLVSSFLVALLSADKHSKAKATTIKRLRTEHIEPISFVEKTLENTKACI